MIDDPDGGFYAQTGWWEKPHNNRHVFIQWTPDAGTFDEKDFDSRSIGTQTTYDTLYLNHPNAFSFGWDGMNRDDEFASFAPTVADVSGEILDLADQMPGDLNQNMSFDYSQAWIGQPGTGNGNWYDFGTQPNNILTNPTPPNWIGNTVWDPNHHFVTQDPNC